MRRARRSALALLAGLAVTASAPGCARLPLPDALRELPLPGMAERPAWELPPPPPADGDIVDESRLTRATLDNGLRVLVLEDRRLPRFSMGVITRRGAANEERAQAGLASFTAELMERGAAERDALELARVVDRLGAGMAVRSDWDTMEARVSGLSRDFDTLAAVLRDVVREPRFDAEEADRVRAETLAALERAKEDPGTLASWNLDRVLYPDHRYGLPQSGTPETVAALGPEEARAFQRRVFTPGNAILFLVGDVEAEEVLEPVREAWGDWQGPPAPPLAPPPPSAVPDARRIVVVDRPDLGQAQIAFGHDGISRDDPRRVPALVMNTVLGGGGFSSRLMSVVRSEEGLTYGIGSGFAQRHRPGPFLVRTFTRAPEARRVIDLVLAEMERMQAKPPEEEELAKAKSQRAGSFALTLETSASVAHALVSLDVYGLPEDSLETFRPRVRAVNVAEVERMAQQLLHPDRTAIVVVGPAEELRPQLEGLGPVEVVTP